MRFRNEQMPTSQRQIEALREPGPEGPIVMVNLLRFRAKAAYPDGRETDLTGREAYMIYANAVGPLIFASGGRVLFAGDVTHLMIGEVEPLWDEVALAEYPSRRALVEMTMSPAWRAIEEHRLAGLEGQLNIETVWQPGVARMLAMMNKMAQA